MELCARFDDAVAEVAARLLADRLNSLPPWRLEQEVELLALRLDPEGAARREASATAQRGATLQTCATPRPRPSSPARRRWSSGGGTP